MPSGDRWHAVVESCWSENRSLLIMKRFVALAAIFALTFVAHGKELLNVSYDPTRELYADFNAAFAKYWKAKTWEDVTINQSHGGS